MNRLTLSLTAAALWLAPFAPAAPINATDAGLYEATGTHTPAIDNYLTGVLGGIQSRSFFLFDLAGITGGTISDATLTLSNRDTTFQGLAIPGTGGSPFSLSLFDVTSTIADVIAGANGLNVFADLGAGTLLGTLAVPSNAPGNIVIPLNAAGLAYLNGRAGGSVILGLSLAAPGATDQFVFFNEGNAAEFADSTRLLDVTTTTPGATAAPEPATCTLMLGALAGLVLLKRSR